MIAVDLWNEQWNQGIHPMIASVAQDDVARAREGFLHLTGDTGIQGREDHLGAAAGNARVHGQLTHGAGHRRRQPPLRRLGVALPFRALTRGKPRHVEPRMMFEPGHELLPDHACGAQNSNVDLRHESFSKTRNPLCVVRISGPVLVCSVQRTLVQTCIYTAALRGTRLSEARLIFMVLIMSTQRMVFAAMITRRVWHTAVVGIVLGIKDAIVIGAAAVGVALAIWIGVRRSSPAVVSPMATPESQATASPAPPAPVPVPLSVPTSVSQPVSTPVPSPVLSPVLSPALSSVLSKDEQGRVARALASGRMEMPANIAVLRGHTGTLPDAGGPAPAFSPTAPVGSAVIEARPQFSWTARTGATRYSVTVFDERFREVAKSGSLKTTTWTPRQNLPRGRVLAWQVSAITRNETAISPAPPQPEARFVVLDAATVGKLAKERARLATEPIALGLVLAKAGLFAEADIVFQTALTDERYDRSRVRALLARLRAR